MGKIRIRPAVMRFAEAMERVLRANDHKGGWDQCTTNYLLKRLREEVRELDDAIDSMQAHCFPMPPSVAAAEAVDVANFAMMIFDNLSPNRAEKPISSD